MMEDTNYVVVAFYNDGDTLDDCCLLGWDSKTDWYDNDTYGFEILNDDGSVKQNNGCTIEIDKWVGVYVSETEDWCKEVARDGSKEGYECVACKLIKTDNGYDLLPLYDDDENE